MTHLTDEFEKNYLSIDRLILLFTEINNDCAKRGEPVVPLDDTEYYTEQIQNIFDLSDEDSEDLANKIKDAIIKR